MPKREKPEGTSDASDDEFASDDNPASVSQDELYGPSELSGPNKRRRVEFESVRLVAVHGVNDINQKVQRAQLYKLSERLLLKDRLLSEEIKKNESYCMRQFQDDTIICMVNRYWTQLNDDLHAIVDRIGPNTSVKEEQAEESQYMTSGFSDIEEKNPDELDVIWQKRVASTLKVTNMIMDAFKAQSDQQLQFNRRLEAALEKEAGENKTTELVALMDAVKAASEHSKLLATQSKLIKEIQTYQQKCQDATLEMNKLQDDIMLKNTKIDELMQQIEDKQFELRKSWAKEAKLDYRLATMAKQQTTISNEMFSNAIKTPTNVEADAVPGLDEAKTEILMEKDKAQARLKEIESLNERLLALSAEVEVLRLKNIELDSNASVKTREYNNLRDHYDELYYEHERVLGELSMAQELAFEIEKRGEEMLNEHKQIEQMTLDKMHQHLNNQERELNKYKGDYEKLRIDIDKNVNESTRQLSLQQDLGTFIKALETQVHNYKQESARFKKKWQDTVKNLLQTKGQLDKEKAYHDQCILVPLTDLDGKIPVENSSKQKGILVEDEPLPEKIEDLRGLTLRLKARIDELRGIEDALQNVASDKRELAEILAKEKGLTFQNARLMEVVRRIYNNEWQNDVKFHVEDHKRKIAELRQQNAVLQVEATNAKGDEEALMAEMDSTGLALEQLQEQNGKLLKQIKEKDDLHLKMMSDRIEAALLESKLKDEKTTLLEQVQLLENMIAAQSHEISQLKTIGTQANANLTDRKTLLRKVTTNCENMQIKYADAIQKLTEEKGRAQNLATQLNNYTEVIETKTREHEKNVSRIRRLKEEQELLKKRLQHVKGTETSIENADEVLLEEINELKEQLTCPSCKVNRKDALLTKCYHVFCMKCIKTRYDMRRRKCPKCNATFGANDYHRIYIT